MSGPSDPRGRLAALKDDRGARRLVADAGGLFGTSVITAVLGAAYWVIAARYLPPETIGVGGAAISALVLVARLGTMGLGTLLLGELAGHPGREWPLVLSALVTAGGISALLGAGFVALAGILGVSNDVTSLAGAVLFSVGCGLTAASFVLDAAFIGLLRGSLQLARNVVASVVKLLLLPVVVLVGLAGGPAAILVSTVGGTALSMLMVVTARGHRGGPGRSPVQLTGRQAKRALRHHVFNLALLAPSLLLPVLAAGVLDVRESGYFYIAFTIASLVLAVPASLGVALYAQGAREERAFSARVRMAFWLSVGIGILATLVMLVAAQPMLSIFGSRYATDSTLVLQILTLTVFPTTIGSLYVPIVRLEGTFLKATAVVAAGMLVGLALAVAGARAAGLPGLAAGWLVGITIGQLPVIRTVARVALGSDDGLATAPDSIIDDAAMLSP